jgi:hypothetical protein
VAKRTSITHPTILAASLRSKALAVAVERVEEAARDGVLPLDVLSRGRPILHLGRPEDLPEEWRAGEPRVLSHISLRRGRVSLTQLRLEGRPVLLKQRTGPSLMLWPLEEGFERPPEAAAVDRLTYLEGEVRRLRERVLRMEMFLDSMHAAGAEFGPFDRRQGAGSSK